jgi:peptidoglycan/xylan/chitin deacetylase (PgdA/CDA1 family)
MVIGRLTRLLSRKKQFRNYSVEVAENSYEIVVESHVKELRLTYKNLGLNNKFATYERTILDISNIDHIEIVPLRRFHHIVPNNNCIVGLRHDVDIDIFTALKCARLLARHGIPGSFFLLHTAYYYGYFQNGAFHRSAKMRDVLIGLMVAGCEIGLHIDPLSIYISQAVDGAEAVRTELEWMRSVGARVDGSVSHNSAPVYGAENFELFKGRSCRTRLEGENCVIPLQVLNESELDLKYEGNFPQIKTPFDGEVLEVFSRLEGKDSTQNKEWMRTYLTEHPIFERGYDYTCWLNGRDRWIIAGHGLNKNLFLWDSRTADMLNMFHDGYFVGKKVILVWHPCYVSE